MATNHRVLGFFMLLLVACGDREKAPVDARAGDVVGADERDNSDGADGAVDGSPRTDGRAEDRAAADESRSDGGALDVGAETRPGTDGRADDGTGPDASRDSNPDLDATGGDTAIDAGMWMDAERAVEAGAALDGVGMCTSARWYCLDEAGVEIPGCGAACGGMTAVQCPTGGDLVCVTARPSMWNDSALNYCIPRRAAGCTTAADCTCLPGDCSQWGGVTTVFRWNCSKGTCVVSCMP